MQSVESLKRPLYRRERRKCIVIICEGEKTEPLYFRALRREFKLSTVEVEIIGEGAGPLKVVEKALREKKLRKAQSDKPDFDEVWCVFDRESENENSTFKPAVEKARAAKIELAVSNPAFEYWYLLHFKETSRSFTNADDVIKELKKHIPDYEKNMEIYSQLADKTDRAIQYAKRRLSLCTTSDGDFPNPCTHVHLLVEKLRSMSIY